MPRKAKRLPGHPGRPDLEQGQPIRTPTGVQYGEVSKLRQAQQAAPLASAPPPPKPDFSKIVAAAQAMPFPSQSLGAPTERPHEPITAGVPVGAGPGPEVLARPTGAPTAAAMFARLAQATGDPAMAALAAQASQQGA